MPAAVLSAPTLAASSMVSPWGRSAVWLIALALGSGVAVGQSAVLVGEIQPMTNPVAVPPQGGTVSKSDDQRRRLAARKKPIQESPPKVPIKRQIEPEPKVVAQAKVKADSKARRSDGLRQPVPARPDSTRMEARWQEIQAALRPARLIVLCDEFQRDFPSSQFAQQIKAIQAGARHAIDIQRSAGLSGDLFEEAVGDSAYRDNLIKAVRGDKDAAYRIALAYKAGTSGVAASPRRREQWLRFSAELGNGLGSWELAQIYNFAGLVADAARFEKKALDLGYQPPPRLPTRGY